MRTSHKVAALLASLVVLTPSLHLRAGQGTEIVPAVVAKVNGRVITSRQYKRLWNKLEAKYNLKGGIKNPRQRELLREQVIEGLVTLELLDQRAEELKIKAAPEEVSKIITQAEQRLGGEEGLKKYLMERGMSLSDYKRDIERSLRINELIKREVVDHIKVKEGEAKEFYDANMKIFRRPEQIRVRHIIVKAPINASAAEKRKAMKKIEEAADRIKRGEPFEEVAKEISEDGAAQRGGDLGYFSRGQMVPEFEDAAFSLKKGEVSGIVETRYGFHIIKLEDKRPAKTYSFNEVKDQIRQYLKQKKAQEGIATYLKDLRVKAKIEILYPQGSS